MTISLDRRIKEHDQALLQRFGSPIIGGEALWRTLGFSNAAAFRNAIRRKNVPVPTFFVPGRKGRFARSLDIAYWLSSIDAAAEAARAVQNVQVTLNSPKRP